MNKNIKKRITVAAVSAMGSCPLLPALTVIAAPIAQNGWASSQGQWYFYKNGIKVVNEWKSDSHGWCYLGADGACVKSSFQTDSKGLCFIGADGYWSSTSAWRQDSATKAWYFIGTNGYAVKNTWAKDSQGWCYLDANGIWVTNDWVKDSQGWCHINATGYWDGQAHIKTGNNIELNDGATHAGIYVISSLGTFGSADASKPTIINGNVTINCPNALAADTINLNNLTINGKLTVNFGAGSLNLNNVKATNMDVSNVGSHTLTFNLDTVIGTLTISDSNSDAHIVVSANAHVSQTFVLSGAVFEIGSDATNSNPFGSITITPSTEPSQDNSVTFSGNFSNTNVNVTAPANIILPAGSSLGSVTASGNLDLSGGGSLGTLTAGGAGAQLNLGIPSVGTLFIDSGATGSSVNVPAGTTVGTLNANAAMNATGSGTIINANFGSSGSNIQTQPTHISVLAGVTATVGGQVRTDSNTTVISSVPALGETTNQIPQSGGGGYVSPTIYKVTAISVDKNLIDLIVGETDTLVANIEPNNATNKGITWTSSDNAIATVDSTGKVTAVGAGNATIKVTTTDGGKIGICNVTVVKPMITGMVKYPDGTPVSGGTIEVYRVQRGSRGSGLYYEQIYGQINDGKFSFRELKDGIYYFSVITDDNSELTIPITKTFTIDNGKVINSADGNIELQLTNPMIIGMVKTPDGTVVTSCHIQFQRRLDNGHASDMNVHDGKFSLAGLEDGIYDIYANADISYQYMDAIAKTFTIKDGVVIDPIDANIEIYLTNPMIKGTVRSPDGTPLNSTSQDPDGVVFPRSWDIRCSSQNGNYVCVRYDIDGRFLIGSLADGTYEIKAIAAGDSGFTDSIIQTITIKDGAVTQESDANIVLYLTNPMIIGTVKNPDGTTASSCAVRCYSQHSVIEDVHMYDGKFLIGELEDGIYNIYAFPTKGSEFTDSIIKTFTMKDGVVIDPIDANIEIFLTNPIITGTVKNPDGTLLNSTSQDPDGVVFPRSWDIRCSSQNGNYVCVRYDIDGRFLIGSLADGTYEIEAIAAWDSGFTDSIIQTITIKDGAVTPSSDANIVLYLTNPMITGTVKNPDGTPASSCGVRWISQDKKVYGEKYNIEGNFVIGQISQMEYTIYMHFSMAIVNIRIQ